MTYYTLITSTKSIKVTELPEFQKFAKRYLSEEDRENIKNTIATKPLIGDLVPGTGGLRKLRVALSNNNKGKSGGARIIYYYHSDNTPILIISGFSKSNMTDMSRGWYSETKKLVSILVKLYEVKP